MIIVIHRKEENNVGRAEDQTSDHLFIYLYSLPTGSGLKMFTKQYFVLKKAFCPFPKKTFRSLCKPNSIITAILFYFQPFPK